MGVTFDVLTKSSVDNERIEENPVRILFVSLGCDKNLVDSEQMSGILAGQGFSFTDDEAEADVVLINTCCFIGDAKQESIDDIIYYGNLKETGRLKGVIVCGCLAQRYAEDIKKELPEVDAIVGTTAYDKIGDVIRQVIRGDRVCHLEDENRLLYKPGNRQLSGPGYSAYLKIAEGCDKRCTYCIIPKVRGQYRSFPLEELVAEARSLADKGVSELCLVAQEITVYGKDLYGKKSLPKLLAGLCEIEGIKWIRLLYCYPEEIDDDLIDMIRTQEKICNYIDMPVQSGSDEVLRRMGRRCKRADILDTVKKLKKAVPDICLRTTLISGFPGESEEDHKMSLELLREADFDRVGVFAYSPEEGTPAYEMDGQISDEIKENRRDELMAFQQSLRFENDEKLIGRLMDVLVEGRDVESGVYVGRTYRDAPDVDGLIFFESQNDYMSGAFVRVRITGTNDYDLMGEEVS